MISMRMKAALRVEGAVIVFDELTELAGLPADRVRVENGPADSTVWVYEVSGVYLIPREEDFFWMSFHYPEMSDILEMLQRYVEPCVDEFAKWCETRGACPSILVTIQSEIDEHPISDVPNEFLRFAAKIGARIDLDVSWNVGRQICRDILTGEQLTRTQIREAMEASGLPVPLLRHLGLVVDDSRRTRFVTGVIVKGYLEQVWINRLASSVRPPEGLRESLRVLADDDLGTQAILVVVNGLGLQAQLAIDDGVLLGCVIDELATRPEDPKTEIAE